MPLFGRKPVIELIAREDDAGQIWAQSATPQQGRVAVEAMIGTEKVSLTLEFISPGTSYDTLDALIARLGYSPQPHLYLTRLVKPLDYWPHLKVLLESKPEPANKRAHEREPFRLRIMSAQLPGYQGVATNISEKGAEIETTGAIPVGTELGLSLEPDRGRVRKLPVRGIVRRCQGSERKFYLGVEFVDLDATSRARLDEITASLRDRSPGVIPKDGPIR